MSHQSDTSSTLLNFETVQVIDHLDLPNMQKHHVRILAHCLQILKNINAENDSESSDEDLLRVWCENQSRKFDDKKFSELFYEQLKLTAHKLNAFSQQEGKNISDLEINDLVLLVKKS